MTGAEGQADPFITALSEWARLSLQKSMKTLHRTGKDLGLSVSQLTTLFRMRATGGLQVNSVSTSLGISNPAASQLLDDMVRKDLVIRVEDSQDRRIRIHRLSPSGEALVKDLKSRTPEWACSLAASFDDAQKKDLLRSLELLNAGMRHLDMHKES